MVTGNLLKLKNRPQSPGRPRILEFAGQGARKEKNLLRERTALKIYRDSLSSLQLCTDKHMHVRKQPKERTTQKD